MSKLLVYTIDDDKDFNMVLKMSLREYEVELKTHTNPQDFTESVKEKMPDLCILDLNLEKDGEGFQLLKAMRNVLGEALPIFVMSKRGSREDVFRAMESGANDFIPKPLDDKYLLLKLKEYMPHCKEVQEMDHSFSKIPATDRDGIIDINFKLIRVGINIFEIESDTFLTKEMILNLKGDIINDIFSEEKFTFKVIESWQVSDTLFRAKLEREFTPEQLFSLRRWLFTNGELKLG
ncbi:MAG: DNA-binding response OmpR family regulator [Bacteriovoracaceae bacterium]|jgi:DNA-binding response OmpR family regulator